MQLLQVEDDDNEDMEIDDVDPVCHAMETEWCQMCEEGTKDLPAKLMHAKWIKHTTHTGRILQGGRRPTTVGETCQERRAHVQSRKHFHFS